MKYVLTGPAHCGKTTVIERLQSLGYPVIGESALEVIHLGIDMMGGMENWMRWRKDKGNEEKFQMAIMHLQSSKECLMAHTDEPVFMDRGVLDCIAYLRLRGLGKALEEQVGNSDYAGVFILAPVQFDAREASGRLDTEDEMIRVHGLIRDIYSERGHRIVDVPVFTDDIETSVTGRVEFILDNIKV